MNQSQPELNLETGFMSFYLKLPQQSGNFIRLFDHGEYYSLHATDAEYVADYFYKTTTVLKYYGNSSYPSCSLSKLNAQILLKNLLLDEGFRVEIWELNNKTWDLSKTASPGHLGELEDMLFTNSDVSQSPVILVARLDKVGDQQVIGVALTDATSNREIGVIEFIDNESFSNFESLLIQQNVKECVLPEENSLEYGKLSNIVNRCNIVISQVKKAFYESNHIVQDLNRLLDSTLDVNSLAELDYKSAMSATACLVTYLQLLEDDSNMNSYTLRKLDLNQYMKLDVSAVKALNLTPAPKDGNKNMSLFGLLNHCKTPQGSRLLGQWIKQPLLDISQINTRQDFVELFFNDSHVRNTLKEEKLKSFPDLHRLAKKFQRGKASLQDVIRVYQVVLGLPELARTLSEYQGPHQHILEETFISKIAEHEKRLENLKNMVETTIDLEAVNNHEYLIRAEFNPDLQELKSKMDEVFKQLKPEAKRVALKLDLDFDKKLKFENNSQYGYHLRVSRADASRVRGNRDYIELRTQKAGVLFTTSFLRKLSSEFSDLGLDYSRVQSTIAKEIISITGTYFPVLEDLNQTIAQLDVYVSLAYIATHSPIQYKRPTLTLDGGILLTSARHPCLEVQDDVSFIANDVQLVKDESTFHIITGPNMGGKSTYIRQIGVICLMAQMGSFVPCEVYIDPNLIKLKAAEIQVVDAILARVGANDSQLKGISTFMAEMMETASILRTATKNSLIIIDELGRGTSTNDGFGLAWAIADFIARNIQCYSLFATHFHEITALENQIPTVKNYHVEAHVAENGENQSLTLLYQVKPGSCDQSFGIHVARIAKFPESVIHMAKRKAAELEDFDLQFKKPKILDEEKTLVVTKFLNEFALLDYSDIGAELKQLCAKYENEIMNAKIAIEQ
ncbi:muts domain V-domain-containing protein [Globomyces pollinis-pini]|nr:muts domain V-domain-containing protein [Globomyces pollinis-pini]